MQKLSKREKLMLYVLALIAIITGGLYFLILPTIDNYIAYSDEVAEVETLVSEMELQITTIPTLEAEVARYQEEKAKQKGTLYAPMSLDQLDALITGMLQSAAFTISSLEMSEMTMESVAPFGANAEEATDGAMATASYPQVYCQTVAVSATARLVDVITLLEIVSNNYSMRVTVISINAGGPSANNPLCDVMMTFAVYMNMNEKFASDVQEVNIERDPNADVYVDTPTDTDEEDSTEDQEASGADLLNEYQEALDASQQTIQQQQDMMNQLQETINNQQQQQQNNNNPTYDPNMLPY